MRRLVVAGKVPLQGTGDERIRFQLSSYRLQRLVHGFAAGLVTAMCGFALAVSPLGTSIESFGLDWLFKWRGSIPVPPEVAVVGISNSAGQALDLPSLPHHWPRTVHPRLVKRLIEQKVDVIVLDLDFRLANPGDEDAIFARSIAEANKVVLWDWFDARKESGARIEQIQPPTEPLAGAARAHGPFPLQKLGPAAFEFTVFTSAGRTQTTAAIALQLKALAVYDDWLSVLKGARAPGVEDLPAHAGELMKPADLEQLMQKLRGIFRHNTWVEQEVDRRIRERPDLKMPQLLTALAALYAGPNSYYINFYGPPGTISTIHYEALLTKKRGATAALSGVPIFRNSSIQPKAFATAKRPGSKSSRWSDPYDLTNHMVFVGWSDPDHPDQNDRYETSFTTEDGVQLNGVEILATAYANLLSQRTLRPSDTMTKAFFVLSFGLLAGILAYLLPATAAVSSALALTGLYYGFVQWRFNETNLWLPLATPALVQLPLALLIGLRGQYLFERRKEKQITRAIRYYLPESLVRDLSERQVDPTTVNRVVFGTCLATDMSGFTALAESKSPRQLALFMNEYFDALAQGIKHHGVDVMEFRADMIMCAWIAPVRSPVISRRGIDAAIEVSEIIREFAEEHGSLRFNSRVGLQSGPLFVGHTGGGGHFAYSIQGDTANTAARLESLNKHLGTHVLAAESVVQETDGLLLRPLGLFRLSGKTDPTSVVEILGRKDGARAEQLDLCSQFAEGLAFFQRKEWSLAASPFEAISMRFVDDGPSRFYLGYCQRFAAETPIYAGPAVIQMYEK
jgi:adenylate cyclase